MPASEPRPIPALFWVLLALSIIGGVGGGWFWQAPKAAWGGPGFLALGLYLVVRSTWRVDGFRDSVRFREFAKVFGEDRALAWNRLVGLVVVGVGLAMSFATIKLMAG